MDYLVMSKRLVFAGLKALRALSEEHKVHDILQDEDSKPLFLQVQLKKVPKSRNMQRINVRLPFTLHSSTEVCLLVGDLDKRNHKAQVEIDILHYKELLEKHGISNISEVITLRQIRTEYKPFEAKQRLLAAYDVFLADTRIVECLPRLLGKHFFTKRKFPIGINMKATNLKDQIYNALATKVFQITGKGNSCCSEVACLDMSDEKIYENIQSMVTMLCKQIHGSWMNVMGLYLKLARSKAIPIYMSYNDSLELSDNESGVQFEVDELTTLPNAHVKVFSDGKVETIANSLRYNSVKIEESYSLMGKKEDKDIAKETLNDVLVEEQPLLQIDKSSDGKVKRKSSLNLKQVKKRKINREQIKE